MNPRLDAIPGSLIRELNALKRPGDIDLGLGEPILPPDGSILAESVSWLVEHGCRYGPNAGLPEVREAVASYLGASGDGIVLTAGSQEAIFLAIKTLCDPDRHEVLVVEPSYPLYRKIALMEGTPCRAVGLPAGTGFAYDAEAILAGVSDRTRLVILCSPCNPTGRIATDAVLRDLATGLSARADPPYVLMDEAYREIYYGPAAPGRFQERYERTLVAGSLSKSNALTGLRLGWLMAPPEVVSRATKVHQFVLTSAGILGQRVALALLRNGRLGAHRPHYAARKQVFCRAAADRGLAVIEPEGALYAMVALGAPWSRDSRGAALRLAEERRVIAIPGVAFGDAAEGWLRCSFVADPVDLAEGAARIAAFLAA